MRNVLERVLNLLAFLLTSNRPVTADEIRMTVAGYAQESEEAFRRMFERDKDLLRRLGVPLEVRATDQWEVQTGYVVSPDSYRLTDPDLTDEERAALWLAAQVVRIGGRPSGPEAILKLGGARTTTGVDPMAADLGADADRLAELFVAVTERREVAFRYHDRARSLQPHGLGHRSGHWYVAGLEGNEERVYRVDRMEQVTVGKEQGAFERRPGLTVNAALARHPWETGRGDALTATVRFDPEAAWWAERRLGPGTESRRNPDGSVEFSLSVNHVDAFLGWVLSFGPQAVVVEPDEIRRALVERLEGVVTG